MLRYLEKSSHVEDKKPTRDTKFLLKQQLYVLIWDR